MYVAIKVGESWFNGFTFVNGTKISGIATVPVKADAIWYKRDDRHIGDVIKRISRVDSTSDIGIVDIS